MKHIGIYPRKSVYRDNSESIAVQISLCKDYARVIYQNEATEFHIYDQDEGFSGKNTNRPSFQALMRDVMQNRLDVVMVYRLDRISRNVAEFSAMFEVFRKHNAAFVSVKESFDTGSPIGRTVMYILAAFAQLERENISGRVADNMEALGAAGKWTGGRLPAGMKTTIQKSGGKQHSYLLTDKEQIWLVELMYDLLLNGFSLTGIERYCRDNHIVSPSGRFLSTSQIYGIITNPIYCQADLNAYHYFQALGCRLPEDASRFDGSKGLTVYGRTAQSKNGTRRTVYCGWHLNTGIHDYVISSDRWIAAQERLGINKGVRSNKYQVGILKGVLRCGCGSRMYNRVYSKNGTLFAYYYCEAAFRKGVHKVSYYRIEEIDALFLAQMKKIRPDPGAVKIRNIQTAQLDPTALRAELRRTQNAISNLTTQLEENEASPAARHIFSRLEALDCRLDSLRSQLRRALKPQNPAAGEAARRQDTYERICFLLDHFDSMSYQEKNELVRRVTQSCTLENDHLEIIF